LFPNIHRPLAIVALTFVSQTCIAALFTLDQQHEPDRDTLPSLSVVLADLHSLFALIYNLTTKLSLALKPSSPTYSASLPVLQDLAKYTSGSVHCITLLHGGGGATLVKDATNVFKGIIDALHALIKAFLDMASAPSGAASAEDYLVRTATLHDLITVAQGPKGIPKDNLSAVRKHWSSHKESLDDGLAEVAHMIEEAEGGEKEDGLDDGWDELGLGGTNPMSKEELTRAKSVQYSAIRRSGFHLNRVLGPSITAPNHPVTQTYPVGPAVFNAP